MSRQNTKNSNFRKQIAHYAKRVSVLQASLDTSLRKRDMNCGALGALMEDTGNRFLDLAEEIRAKILARRSEESAPRSARTAGGNPR